MASYRYFFCLIALTVIALDVTQRQVLSETVRPTSSLDFNCEMPPKLNFTTHFITEEGLDMTTGIVEETTAEARSLQVAVEESDQDPATDIQVSYS